MLEAILTKEYENLADNIQKLIKDNENTRIFGKDPISETYEFVPHALMFVNLAQSPKDHIIILPVNRQGKHSKCVDIMVIDT